MIVTDKPLLDEVYLEHFGVKGMRWGQRKRESSGDSSDKKSMSTKKKVAIGVGVVAGTAAVAYLLSRRGKVSVKQVMGAPKGLVSPPPGRTFIPDGKGGFLKRRDGSVVDFSKKDAARMHSLLNQPRDPASTAARGKAATSDISQSEWKKRVAALRSDIASANDDQDRFMRKQGLGSVVNKPKTNVNMGDLNDVKRALNDPNHIWHL